jgi:hypothetical protein
MARIARQIRYPDTHFTVSDSQFQNSPHEESEADRQPQLNWNEQFVFLDESNRAQLLIDIFLCGIGFGDVQNVRWISVKGEEIQRCG